MYDNNSVAIKKGKRAGTTLLAHNFNPFFAAIKQVLENIIKEKAKHTKIIENICFFIENVKKRLLFLRFEIDEMFKLKIKLL